MKKLIALFLLTLSSIVVQAADSNIKTYPLDRCIVSDEKLGEMGPPVVFVYQNQEIKLCCKDCRKDLDANPEKYLPKLSGKSGAKPSDKTVSSSEVGGTVVKLTVDGLVCNFCAANIEKSFRKLSEVSDVYVNLACENCFVKFETRCQILGRESERNCRECWI
jgi:hypothetical protein